MLSYHFIDIDPEMDQEPIDDDYVIVGHPSKKNELVRCEGKSHGSFQDENEICHFIMDQMEKEEFYPNIWYQNERGNLDLCVIEEE